MRLRVEEASHFLVLYLIKHSLQQLFQVVLAHDGVGHCEESLLGVVADILASVLQVVGELRDELVRVLEEQDIVAHAADELAEALADAESHQARLGVDLLLS